MKRVLKYFFSLLAAVVVLCFVAGAWLIHDGDWIRGKTGEYVSGITGRQFSIDGPLDIDLSLHPVISAEDLRLANTPWAGDTDLASLKKIRFSIDFLSLFSDQIAFHFIELEGLDLALAENDQGEVNWDLLPPMEQDAEDEEPMDDLPVSADRLVLKDIHVSFDAPGRDKPLDFVLLEAEVEKNDDGLALAAAHGSLGDLPLEFHGRAGPLKHLIIGGALELKIDLSLGEIDFNLAGNVADSLTGQGADVTINFSGPDITWVTQQFALPEFTQGPFDFDLKLETGDYDTELNLVGDLGQLDIDASANVDDFRRPREGHTEFEITGPDLKLLGEALGEPHLVSSPYHFKGDLSAHLGTIEIHTFAFEVGENTGQVVGKMGAWPDLIDTELHLYISGPDLSQWGPVLGVKDLRALPFSYSGHLANKGSNVLLTTNRLDAGDSRIELAGTLGLPPEFLGTSIDVDVYIPDLSEITVLPDHDELPPEPLTIQGGIVRKEQMLLLNNMQIGLGENRVSVNGQIALSEDMVGSKWTSQVVIPNLASVGRYFQREDLPNLPASINADLDLSASGLSFKLTDSKLGDMAIDLEGTLPDLQTPYKLSANVHLEIPSLRKIPFYPQAENLPDLPGRVSGHVEYLDQQLSLVNVTGSVADSKFDFDALLVLEDKFSGSHIDFETSGPDFRPLIPIEALAQLQGKFRVSGHVEYLDQRLRLTNITGLVANSKFDIDALLTFEEKFAGSHIEFEISGPDFRPLLAIDSLAFLPGKFRARGRVEKGAGADQLKGLELNLGSMRARINGTVDDLTRLTSADLSASVSLPSLSELDGFMEQDFPDVPFSMEVSFAGTGSQFTLDPLKAKLGPSDLSGKISMNLKENPVIEGQIRSDFLDLAWLTAPDEGKKAAAKTDGRVFPDAPIPYREYGRAKVDLDLSVDHLKLEHTELDGVRLDLSLSEDYFRVNSFEFGGPLGETLSGRLAISGSETETQLEFQMEGDELRLGLATAEDQDVSTYPPTSISMEINGKGATWHRLASSLDGRIRIVQGKGLIANAGLELLFSDLLSELFNTLNPFAKKSVYTELECAVINAVIDSGKVLVDPIIFHTEQITILSGGQIDLETEKINLEFQTKVRKGIGISASMAINPFIKLGGTLAKPAIELDPAGVAFSGSVAVATVGLSLVGKSLFDRFFGNKDPCGEALKRLDKAEKEP